MGLEIKLLFDVGVVDVEDFSNHILPKYACTETDILIDLMIRVRLLFTQTFCFGLQSDT